MYRTNFSHLFLFIILISLIGACRGSDVLRPGEPVDSAYAKATRLYEKGKYSQAATAFESITRVGRGTEFAEDAQYFLASSYFNDRNYLLAASEYERFISFYPNDSRREEVDFQIALCYKELSPRYKLDQSDTIRALEAFQLFNNRYPDSDRVIESAKYIDELRSKLARKYYMAADFYLRTDRYEAAAIYYGLTIDQFPEAPFAEAALVKQIETYVIYADKSITEKQRERYEKALASYNKFLQLFPRSEEREKVENLRDRAEEAISKINTDAVTESSSIDEK